MKSSILTFSLSLILATTLAHGAVIMVSPGQSVQAAVDGANTGDNIVLGGGIFDENVTIDSKSLSIRSFSSTSEIRSLNIINAAGLSVIQNLQITDLNSTGSNLLVKKSTIGNNLSVNGGEFRIIQSSIYEKLLCKAPVSKILYNDLRYAEIEGNSTLIGNHFDGRNFFGIGIDLNGSHTNAIIHNNRIHNYKSSSTKNISEIFIGIRVVGNARAEIINNIIYDCYDNGFHGEETKVGLGIYVESTRGTTILGNALWNCYVDRGVSGVGSRLIWAPPSGVIVENNSFWKLATGQSNQYIGGGVIARDSVEGNPKFTDKDNGDFTLASDSPAINAGPPDPRYNDRDGSRNDIGMFGGHNFIPDGRTTNKPIVLGLDVAPIAVPVGGTVTIESTGTTVE
jgi:hypothetical protein